MEKSNYEKLKADFKTLTGKIADDNFEAFSNYLVFVSNVDNKAIIIEIRDKLDKIIGKT